MRVFAQRQVHGQRGPVPPDSSRHAQPRDSAHIQLPGHDQLHSVVVRLTVHPLQPEQAQSRAGILAGESRLEVQDR